MPIVDDEQIKALLADERISAITVDTNIFDEKGLQLNSPVLQAIAGIKDKPFEFLLSGTVAKEIDAHLVKETEAALRSVSRAVGQAVGAFETKTPTRDELVNQISGGRSAEEAARQRFEQYISDTGCKVLDDTKLVDVSTLFDGYFGGQPPFGSGKKKNEFPDALALNALEATAAERGTGVLVVSKDGDWRAFCEKSERLYLVPEIERALALITNAPLGLRDTIYAWLSEGGQGHQEARQHISLNVERLDFTANAHPTHGEVEISTWAGELKGLTWPDASEIDIIEIEEPGESEPLHVVVSLPVDLVVSVLVELSFSFWDSVDKESMGMGGRSVEVDEDLYIRATITLDIHGLGTEDEDIVIEGTELDDQYHEIELGEVNAFEPEDYWDGEA